MPAPVVNAMRAGKAHGIGPFADAEQPQMQGAEELGKYERHKEGAAMHGAEALAEKTGEGLFGKAIMLGIGGWVGAKSLGWWKPNAIPKIGKFTYAPVHALDSLSLKDFNMNNLKANYFHKLGEYVDKHGAKKGLSGSQWYAKADALGGAKLADTKWEGLKNIVPYMKKRPIFSSVMMGGLALGGAISLLRSGKHAKDGLDDLIEVAEDLDGKHYSRYDMINHPEKLSPEMREIRANLKAHLIPDAAGAVGHVIENGAFAAMGGPAAHAVGGMMGGMGNMGVMMGGMMLGQSAEAFRPSLDFLKSYLLVKDMQADGKVAPAEVYATLLASASTDVRRLGGKDIGMVQRLAEQYVEEGMSAKDLVHEVFAGEPFKARMTKITEEIQAEQQTEEEAVAPTEDAAPEIANKNEAPVAANVNAAPAKAALSNVAHEGKVDARALQMGGRA